ncbi:CUB and sushi domain-containing protein 1-like [Actinia tenebrosa]|uniref:CUB and sushi domain-containing protein 1-like n=1 Tax=Actinia tenebrosa TaxID=6105 RepID=A0A6P8HPV9_ACTTE|nr:CUB and sushi domain-containing protein 1-like [Actinia tenebrosa]
MRKYLVVLMLVYNYIESVTSQACSRASMIRDGTCTTQCVPSTGCPEPDSDCLCDSQCGYSCVKRGLSCGPAPTIRNADLTSSGTAFNDTVVYTCQSGYTINGDNVRRCTAKGTWSGVGPTCLPVCQQPDLPFGSYVKTNLKSEYKTGESVTLDCKTGFIKEGNPRRICISGRWTAFPFECKATHSCPRAIRGSRYRCANKCSPDDPDGCLAGHRCLCDGQCGYSCVEQGLQCPSPTRVKNALIKFNSTGYNGTVTYKCQENFTLNGDRVRRCTAKKRWEGAVPSCLPDCGQPRVPQHAYIENKKSKYASGDRVTFKCDAGYNQEGISTTLCFMGRWNVMPFRCDKGGCGDPGTPENGNKLGISYAPGWEVFFSCNIGYVRVGSGKRRCLHNNTWSGTQPTCKLIDCGPPQVLKNGTIIGGETTSKNLSLLNVMKDSSWTEILVLSVSQTENGVVSAQTKLVLTKCSDPGTPMNGIKKGLSRTTGSLVFFACNFGYKILGSLSRQCLANKKWSGVQPTCLSLFKSCVNPLLPENAYIANKKSKYLHGDAVTFKCNKGFLPVGINRSQCFMGRWSTIPFSCINTKL